MTTELRMTGFNKIMGAAMTVTTRGFNKDLNYEESQLNQAYIVNLNSKGFTFEDEDIPERFFKSMIAAVSMYLCQVKSSNDEEAVAIILSDVDGRFKFAGIVKHMPGTDDNEPGNWNYSLTLNEEDINEVAKERKLKKYYFGDDAFKCIFEKAAYDVGSIEMFNDRYFYEASITAVDTITAVLDQEAVETEVTTIDVPGFFKASVKVEDGEKVYALTPYGEMKAIVKGTDVDAE